MYTIMIKGEIVQSLCSTKKILLRVLCQPEM